MRPAFIPSEPACKSLYSRLYSIAERAFNHPSPAGNRHSLIHACLANGQPKAAEFFASLGVPLDLPAAAAIGRLAVVQGYFDENGVLQSPGSPQQLELALKYASWYGRKEVVEFLQKNRDSSPASLAGMALL